MELFTNLEKRRRLFKAMFYCFIVGISIGDVIASAMH